jgi:flagellar hook assembly protein FlgD
MRTLTRLEFFLPQAAPASLRIVNVAGQVVRVLTEGPRTQGFHPLSWDGRDWRGRPMASGIYLSVLETPTAIESRTLTLIR